MKRNKGARQTSTYHAIHSIADLHVVLYHSGEKKVYMLRILGRAHLKLPQLIFQTVKKWLSHGGQTILIY